VLLTALAGAVVCLMFFLNLRNDFRGSPARQPGGFEGAVITLIVTGILVVTFHYAGAFCRLW
jgi:hypothetical protein